MHPKHENHLWGKMKDYSGEWTFLDILIQVLSQFNGVSVSLLKPVFE